MALTNKLYRKVDCAGQWIYVTHPLSASLIDHVVSHAPWRGIIFHFCLIFLSEISSPQPAKWISSLRRRRVLPGCDAYLDTFNECGQTVAHELHVHPSVTHRLYTWWCDRLNTAGDHLAPGTVTTVFAAVFPLAHVTSPRLAMGLRTGHGTDEFCAGCCSKSFPYIGSHDTVGDI